MRVLFVDDEPKVLDGFRRQLRKHTEILTATSGLEGLDMLEWQGPFAVVVSDMRMPGMSGTEFLAAVRERSPDSVRIVLSGQADLESAIAAVNEGQIFRFLTKPCSADALRGAVDAGLAQHRLIIADGRSQEIGRFTAIAALLIVIATAGTLLLGSLERFFR